MKTVIYLVHTSGQTVKRWEGNLPPIPKDQVFACDGILWKTKDSTIALNEEPEQFITAKYER